MPLITSPVVAALLAVSPCPQVAMPPAYLYDHDRSVNAWTDYETQIGVAQGMWDKIESPDELAFVIGHEMGHVCLHGGSEYEADALGQETMVKAGYSPAAGPALLRRLNNPALAILSWPAPSPGSRASRLEKRYATP